MKVFVTVTNQHWIHKHVVHKMIGLIRDNRHNVRIIMPSHKPYENNLHHIVKDFIEGDYDFWLNMDSDNPPLKNPLDLVELDKDVLGLPTPVWHYTKKGERPVYWNAYDYVPEEDAYKEHFPKEGLQRVDAVGTGCVLFAKRVFENKYMRVHPFMRKCFLDGRVEKGNDISFCERARANGFEIWCHYDYFCDHFSELSLNETVNAFRNLYEMEQSTP